MPESKLKTSLTLSRLIELSRSYVMTAGGREAQRQSFARSLQPCEHSKADWEQCDECWAEHYAKKGKV